MNIRDRFVQVSTKLQADFKMATATSHTGLKGSAREEAIRAFLTQHLPRRYAVGTGQVMSPTGRMSRQCDVVIYDPVLGPNLPLGDSAAIFPIEVVYGTVEIKSDLTSEELRLAYENIASVKALAQAGTFVRDQGGMVSVVARPVPWGAVLAYTATRSLKAVAEQVRDLDSALGGEILRRPDSVVVLDAGIVGPGKSMRVPQKGTEPNRYGLPTDGATLSERRSTGRHTLLRFYLDMLDDLGSLVLEQPRMKAYIDAPQVVGKHLVRQRQVMKQPVTSAFDPAGKVHVLGRKAIEALVELCKEQSPATYEDYLKSMFPGGLNVTNVPKQQLQMSMSIYNPRCVAGPLLDVVIDGRTYACDLEALEEHLGEDPFVEVEDITAGELMAFSGAVERLDDTNKGAG